MVNNPNKYSEMGTGSSLNDIRDDDDFPHVGIIKALADGLGQNFAVSGFNASSISATSVTISDGKIFRDGKLVSITGATLTISAGSSGTGDTYALLVAPASGNVTRRLNTVKGKTPSITAGDTIIGVLVHTGSNPMQIQYLTLDKTENSLSIGYDSSGYTEAGSLTGSADGITMTGLYKLDTLPTATVAAADKVIIQDTDDSDKIKTVTTQAIANLASITNISDADGDTKIQMEESSDEDKIRFDTAGTERMIIDNAGNVGIGTNAPTELLHLSDADGTEPTILIDNTGTSGSEPELVFLRSTGTGSDSRDIGNIKFKAKDTAGNDHTFVELFVDQEDADTGTEDGRLIINTTKEGTDSREMLRISGGSGIIFNNSALDVDFKVKGDGDGNLISTDAANDKVGIGTGTPNQKLTVSGSMGASGFVGAVVEVTGSPASPILNISPESHRTIIADTQTFDPAGPSGGPLALTLPAASGTHIGFEFRIIAKNSAAAADALTLNVTGSDVIIDATGATIGNSSTAFTLTTGKIYTVIHISSSQYMAIILN
tara:strand:- start:210 stop:1847 length:1638 start_codon:yes stop_codon:yes gene_type:complete